MTFPRGPHRDRETAQAQEPGRMPDLRAATGRAGGHGETDAPHVAKERDRERSRRRRLGGIERLVDFALWMSPVWDAENADDRAAAREWALHYLEGGDRG